MLFTKVEPMSGIQGAVRFLLIRLDRIGDVVLSTPLADQLRQAFPEAFIAMMVRTDCGDVVRDIPALNRVILYDKEAAHRSLAGTLAFALSLRSYHFDVALVLHPSNRSHWIPWLAGIPVRIGYDRKSSWLLTHRIPHRKQQGRKHEASYTLDFLEFLGVSPQPPSVNIPVNARAKERVAQILTDARIYSDARLVAIHPSASCVSKRWMPERFAKVADRLVGEQGASICLVAGYSGRQFAGQVAGMMHNSALNLGGQLSVADLAALLRRCSLLISNDSGPVHIAAGVGTPVVDIFGRNQRGLSPLRWQPLGEGHMVLHKEVGCETCLAHNCDIGFLCLTSLSVEEVYEAAAELLRREPSRLGQDGERQ